MRKEYTIRDSIDNVIERNGMSIRASTHTYNVLDELEMGETILY